ncbi:hypothetical protein [Hymenobacter negativus]|uniref:Uncharacterized protein n=1 Tax=Hymenobacter negativus TaxID=2795026 RepID=A0ABS3Q9B6_9BACT|nr:hypothetical protein [Hymenobacter negativus]MBO2007568.1 hypothetical protein [Hymenobacter negativus]
MSYITIKEAYSSETVYDDPENPQASTTITTYTFYRFNTDSRQVEQETGSYNAYPPAGFSFVGEFWSECSGTTRLGYVHDGAGGFTIEEEEDSLSCGFVPTDPLTCDLVLSVTQTTSVDGTTAEVVATGVNGRARYRLDGGPEQLSPFFYNVAPGAHQADVRDDGLASCRRSVRFVVDPLPPVEPPTGAPEGVDLVGQPRWCQVPAPAGATVLVELWAESAHGADDFTRVFVSQKQASATGVVATRLDSLLWPLLQPVAPPMGAAAGQVQVCRTNLVNYFVRTAVLVPGRVATYETGPLRTALRGALPAEWRHLDYFTYRLDAYAQPPFLTWQPAGQALTPAQPQWLFWLCPAGSPAALTVRRSYVRTGFAGGTPLVEDESVSLSAGRGPAFRLLAIPVKPRPNTDSVSVGLYTAQGESLSPLVSYPMVAETERSRYVCFTNSFGCLDTLRAEGRLDGTLEATATLVDRPPLATDGRAAPTRLTFDVQALRKLKLATGWLTAAEQAWLQELVLAREIWQVHPRLGVLPLAWPKRSLAVGGDEPPLRGMTLEFDYAFDPTAYARF